MTSFTFANSYESNKLPAVLPLTKEDAKKLPTKALTGLSATQKESLKTALKSNAPQSGMFAVYTNKQPVFVVMVGEAKELKRRDARDAGLSVAANLRKHNVAQAAILSGSLNTENSHVFAQGAVLGAYEYHNYKGVVFKEAQKKSVPLKKLHLVGKFSAEQKRHLKAEVDGVAFTRDLINKPPSEANPAYMEKLARQIAKIKKVSVKVLQEKELKKLKCEALLAVGRASPIGSRLIILTYKGGKPNQKPLALVGKGVTYDTDGLSLKPSRYMVTMKQDLGGAATVLGAFKAIAESGLKKNVIAVVPTVENCIDGTSYKPDDVVTAMNGVSIEVTNTDAEGRLILADALSYTCAKLKPAAIVDLATLTGACAYAVGEDFAAALGTDEKLMKKLFKASESVDEPVWELPLHQRYKELLKSPIADIVNSADKFKAGTIEGGMFLQHFVEEKMPWVHMDIASVTFDDAIGGATGRNVRLLKDLAGSF